MARIDQVAFELHLDEWLARNGPDAVKWSEYKSDIAGFVSTSTVDGITSRYLTIRANASANYIRVLNAFSGSPDEVWAAFHFRIPDYGSYNRWRLASILATNGVNLLFEVCPGDAPRLDYDGTEYYATTVIPLNTWVHVEIHLKIHATLGEFHLWLDEAEEITQEGIDTTLGGATAVERLYLDTDDISGGDQRVEHHFDNVIIQDSTGVADNSQIGVRYLEPVLPNASGDVSQWSLFPDAGESDYEDIDEAYPNDDTDYLFKDTDGNQFLVNLANWVGLGKVPLKVHLTSIAKREGGSISDAMKLIAKSGVTIEKSASIELADGAYQMNVWTLDDDPGGGAWLEAGIDALQIGAECFDV